MGALLTQNTNWIAVEKSLSNLKAGKIFSPQEIYGSEMDILNMAIRPSGYYNQKSKRLKILAKWFLNLGNEIPSRDELLSLNGIGPETADSILLYAFKVPSFVVDSYTRKIFSSIGLINEKDSYDVIKRMFEENLEKNLIVFQEYHALIVEHAKRYYTKGKDSLKCTISLYLL